VYAPGADAFSCGWPSGAGAHAVADGLGMLIEQAAESFLFWARRAARYRSGVPRVAPIAGPEPAPAPPSEARPSWDAGSGGPLLLLLIVADDDPGVVLVLGCVLEVAQTRH